MKRFLGWLEAATYIVFVCVCFVVIAGSVGQPFSWEPVGGLALIPLLFLARAAHVLRGASDDF